MGGLLVARSVYGRAFVFVVFGRIPCRNFARILLPGIERLGLFHEGLEFLIAHLLSRLRICRRLGCRHFWFCRNHKCFCGSITGGSVIRRLRGVKMRVFKRRGAFRLYCFCRWHRF